MKILAIVSGEYGARHVSNLVQNGPPGWWVETWQAPALFPPVIDYPEDYLPGALPACDLLLHFGEQRGIAELVPEIAKMTGAQAVIAGIDNEAWLPRGLARQMRGWLEAIGVTCVTPKPLCSLTEHDYGLSRHERVPYQHPLITEFARHFGQPDLALRIDPETHLIISAEIRRDAVCGCARHVAERLVGLTADEAEEKAGLLHHHFPCLASMGKDPDFGDTLMHISGNVLKDNVGQQVKPFKSTAYIAPATRSDQITPDQSLDLP